MSAFKDIHAAVVAALTLPTPVAPVYPTRARAVSQKDVEAIVVQIDRSEAEPQVLGAQDWRTDVVVEGVRRYGLSDDPVAMADDLLLRIDARLQTINAASIGAISIGRPASIGWDFESDGDQMCAVGFTFSVLHRTHQNDLVAYDHA